MTVTVTVTAEVFVVALSGVSGAGKSSIINRVVEEVGRVAELRFDDYATVSTYPADLGDWLARGADLDEWKTPHLADDLRRLRQGQAVELPAGKGKVEPAELVLLEEPFGKIRSEMAGLIDLAAYVEVPADVLLARRLLRRYHQDREHPEGGLAELLRQDLHHHLQGGRALDARASAAILEGADLVLDGLQTVEHLAGRLLREIETRRG